MPTGELTPLGAIRDIAGQGRRARQADGDAFRSRAPPSPTQWEIWVYPPTGRRSRRPTGWSVSRELGRRHEGGPGRRQDGRCSSPRGRQRGQSLPGRFLPVFWSPVWFPTQKPNTMGILCDPKHPLLAAFPTEFYSNWQWYDLLDQQSRSLILDDTPADFRPIVQVIDNFARNHKLGNLFEARVGEGRLLVCTIDLLDNLDRRPAAKQLLRSLYGYVASDRFQPAGQLGCRPWRSC